MARCWRVCSAVQCRCALHTVQGWDASSLLLARLSTFLPSSGTALHCTTLHCTVLHFVILQEATPALATATAAASCPTGLAPGLGAADRKFLVSALSSLSAKVFGISVFRIWTFLYLVFPGAAHPQAAGGKGQGFSLAIISSVCIKGGAHPSSVV